MTHPHLKGFRRPRFLQDVLDPHERRLMELQMWAVSRIACRWITDLEPYEPARVAGVVQRLVVDPLQASIEVTITDGTASLVANWNITRPTPELAAAPGTGVVLEGVAYPDDGGHLVMHGPALETMPFPDVA